MSLLTTTMPRSALLSLLLPLALLAGCAAPPRDPAAPQLVGDLTDAATTPLGDLNLMRAEIPAVLQAAQQAPYALPADRRCPALAAEIRALDAVLGADLDTPADQAESGLIERGVDYVGHSAVNTVRRTAESVVPFRSWVRKLTGAERQARRAAAAITAGTIRRAFLKGLARAEGCEVPVVAPAAAASGSP